MALSYNETDDIKNCQTLTESISKGDIFQVTLGARVAKTDCIACKVVLCTSVGSNDCHCAIVGPEVIFSLQ